jgi:Fe2+ or Zn2+ uptake regulation protein
MQENKDLLFKDGFRKTGPRQFILEVLEYAKKPLSVEEVFITVNKKIPCDQATVYRNLKAMVEKEIVSEKYFCHGHAHYEIAGEPSSYIVCKYCETIAGLPDPGSEIIAKKLFKKTKGFAYYDGYSFEVYGVCNSCARSKVK